MLNWLLRYQPVIDVLASEAAGSVLDVGSGWYGLSWYWPGTVVQTDLHFRGVRPAEPRRGAAHFVRSSAERLPFADASFDQVVSLDMLEHLPHELREASVRELTRVARRTVVIGFPCGKRAQRVDRALALAIGRTPRRSVPDWLSEHLDQQVYPDADLVARSLPPEWYVDRTSGVGNAALQGLVVYAEEVPLGHRLTRLLETRYVDRRVPRLFDRGAPYRSLQVVKRRA